MSLASIADSIKLLATIAGIVVIAYAGLMLTVTKNINDKNEWKEVIIGVVLGLSIVYLSPVLSTIFSGGHYCG